MQNHYKKVTNCCERRLVGYGETFREKRVLSTSLTIRHSKQPGLQRQKIQKCTKFLDTVKSQVKRNCKTKAFSLPATNRHLLFEEPMETYLHCTSTDRLTKGKYEESLFHPKKHGVGGSQLLFQAL